MHIASGRMPRLCKYCPVGNLSQTAHQVVVLTLRGVTTFHKIFAALSSGSVGYRKQYWKPTVNMTEKHIFQVT